MEFKSFKTSLFKTDQSLIDFIIDHMGAEIKEKSIVAVTSKIVSLAESCLVSGDSDKVNLVKDEADVYLGEIGYGCHLTIKEGLLIASAGIDESNSEGGEFILYPKKPYLSAQRLCEQIKEKLGIKELGVILTDSHTIPLRKGVTGVTLAYAGFRAVKNMVGQKDLFGRELMMTSMNIVDGLSATATLMMGEGDESCPLVLIEGASVEFVPEVDPNELMINYEEDLYYPLYSHFVSSSSDS